ncbi:MAG TPA: YceI family protein [Myxococcaceae bacterium]|nr:YceI family protein [Myxococcaceae bacterium]
MRRTLLSAVAAVALASPFAAFAEIYEIDSAHSAASFSVRHMMVTNVRGQFGKVTGTLNLDEKDISRSTVEAAIDVTTINTSEPKRDEHLKAPDFFDVAKYPSINFKSTKVEQAGQGRLKVTGDLTMHGVTKPVVLDVAGPTAESKDPWGNLKRGVEATAKLNRKDFGLSYNKALETGGVAVGEEVAVTIDLQLAKKKEAAPAAATATPAKTEAKPSDVKPAKATKK